MSAVVRAGRMRKAWRAVVAGDVDTTCRIGAVELRNPVMTASGTAGHGDELEPYFPLSSLGAVVVKSISPAPWPGNPAPRVHETPSGMLNSVGLQGPGIEAWARDDLPRLAATGARVVVSIWGQRVADYAEAASQLSNVDGLTAIEVNVSCPNVEDRRRMFAHSAKATAEVLAVVREANRLPLWAKLSPNVADLAEIASAAVGAGADAVTLINTVLGMTIDIEGRRPLLGAGGGGLSGAAIHPVAVRAVYDVRCALPGAAIIGVGGVMTGADAIELLMAGADGIQVGTATFRDPRAPLRILEEMEAWCARRGIRAMRDLIGAAHGR
ncbi:MAG TPA: dihydroorotate dehydrogenase [Acidimicrobiales bacterium]|jgi:dihydroorotate dehydrogenase (NAD+) catalytic subunit|nr:dihydroorotate dehydrogenase [Acidimicrobiales bacterium]